MRVRVLTAASGLVLVLLLVTAAGACGVVSGSGDLVTREPALNDFSRVEAGNGFEVSVTAGTPASVKVTIDDNIEQYLDVGVKDGTLHVELEDLNAYSGVTRRAVVVLPNLEALELNGSSQAQVRGFTDPEQAVEFALSGASEVDLEDITAGDVTVSLSGASRATGGITMGPAHVALSGGSKATLSGAAGRLSIDASGGSSADLARLPAESVDAQLSGGSEAVVTTSGRLDADLSGGSDLSYGGSPRLGAIDTSGGSDLHEQ
jgi:hypothetical protein